MATATFAALHFLLITIAVQSRSRHHNFIKKHKSTSPSTSRLKMSGPVQTTPFPPVPEFHPDLDAYFARIGYTGPGNACLETLRQIHWGQLKSIPFENLDIHLGLKISSDPPVVQHKLLQDKRGGYCNEQNVLLLHILRALGYKVTPLAARVLFGKPTDRVSGLAHVLLKVECEGHSWLVDAGFGHYGPLTPLRLGVDGVTSEQNAFHRVVSIDHENFKLQVKISGSWDDLYRYNLSESFPSDWEIACHYCSTFEQSKFVKNIIVTRFADTSLYVLVNKQLTIRKHIADCKEGENFIIEKRDIKSQHELLTILNDYFDIKLEEGTALSPPGTTWDD